MGSGSPHRHRRATSDFALNGENGDHSGPPYCNGGSVNGKKSTWRVAVSTVRLHLLQLISPGRRKSVVGTAAYLATCVFLVWCGLQIPDLLRGNPSDDTPPLATLGGGVEAAGVRAATSRGRELASSGGRGRDGDVGPTLAYGIMVYQRKGFTPQMTLDQFARMFRALYDEDNT